MIVHSNYHGTFTSKLTLPEFRGLMAQSIRIHNEATKTGKRLDFKCNVFYEMQEFESGKQWEVFKSQSIYEILTNGKITEHELYGFIKESMEIMVTLLNRHEQNVGIHPTQVKIIPMRDMMADLTPIVTEFSK